MSRRYFDRAVAHHLALSTKEDVVPPLGLLQERSAVPTRVPAGAFCEQTAGRNYCGAATLIGYLSGSMPSDRRIHLLIFLL